MSLMSLVVLLVVAGICGSIGQSIAGYSRTGCIGSIFVGFVGALLGMWISRLLHLPEPFAVHIGGETFPLVWSVAGSAVFVAIISAFTRRRD